MVRAALEVHTKRADGRYCVLRTYYPSYYQAYKNCVELVADAFPEFARYVHYLDFRKGFAPEFDNDFGEEVVYCVAEYGSAAQADEGVFLC